MGSDADMAVLGITVVVLLGAMLVVSGVIDLIIGIVGLRASKENGKHTAAFVLGIIGVVWAVISLIVTVAGGSADGNAILSGLVGLVLPVLYLVGVNQTRRDI